LPRGIWSQAFGEKHLERSIWRETFGEKHLERNIWREAFGRNKHRKKKQYMTVMTRAERKTEEHKRMGDEMF